jgi:hypothetical protein
MGQGSAVNHQASLAHSQECHGTGWGKSRLCVLGVIFALGLIALPAWVLASPPAQEQVSDNLLVDGDFEEPPTWPMQDGISEVQVAPGWQAYYLDAPPEYVQAPNNCSDHPHLYDCFWMRPEFRDNTSFAHRIHSGERSQKYFSYGRMHEAGLFQQVYSIPLGARVRFSIWMQAWMCFNPDKCGKGGIRSDEPAEMHLRVGIDPLGGSDPFTTTVAWSVEQPAWDTFVQFQVETVALSETVTVFTHSRVDWPWPRNNNDVYLDDASLVMVGAYATPTPVVYLGIANPTATPLPDNAITHSVQIGETLFDVALKYNMKTDDLLSLNQLTTATQLYVGQPLIVKMVSVTLTPKPEPTVTPEPSATPLPTVTRLPTLTPTALPTSVPVAAARPSVLLPAVVVAVVGLIVIVVTIVVAIRVARQGNMMRSPGSGTPRR